MISYNRPNFDWLMNGHFLNAQWSVVPSEHVYFDFVYLSDYKSVQNTYCCQICTGFKFN